MIVPMLRVGMHPRTLRVPLIRVCDAERHGLHSHAERGNDHYVWLLDEFLVFDGLFQRLGATLLCGVQFQLHLFDV